MGKRFTLIELMIVFAIATILVAIAIPSLEHAEAEAARNKLLNDTPVVVVINGVTYETTKSKLKINTSGILTMTVDGVLISGANFTITPTNFTSQPSSAF